MPSGERQEMLLIVSHDGIIATRSLTHVGEGDSGATKRLIAHAVNKDTFARYYTTNWLHVDV